MTLIDRLKEWQQRTAAREGVEAYRVLPHATLVTLAHTRPASELELLQVKGIGAVKVRRYGAQLLAMIAEDVAAGDASMQSIVAPHAVQQNPVTGEMGTAADTLSVTAFLSALNVLLGSHFRDVRIRGEVADFRRNHTGHAYFAIKDAASIVRVTMFRGAYDLSGVELADGMEVIITGQPQHHQQYGFSVIAQTVEVAGEGALKKAYDALKRRLGEEGLLDAARKRPLPALPRRIGVITSRDGAAIGDFMTNLGRYGLQIVLMHSAVEGQHAIHGLVAALARLHAAARAGDIDALVITRGGGSLESLQAFNNENIVRAIAAFPVPVVAGIGHERDETLATLVADVGVSTPTAAARAVCASWDDAAARVDRAYRVVTETYAAVLRQAAQRVDRLSMRCTVPVAGVFERFRTAWRHCEDGIGRYGGAVTLADQAIAHAATRCLTGFDRGRTRTVQRLGMAERLIAAHDPARQLARGYAIVRSAEGRVVRHVGDVAHGDALALQLSDGTIKAKVA